MSKFKAAVMTDAGAELLAKSIAEGFRLEFVKMVTGSGIYEVGEKAPEELRKRMQLKSKEQEVGFNSAVAAEGNAVKLKALITNEKLEVGYRLTEVGIIAKREDDEILYSIAIAEEADYLPAKENPIEITQEYYTVVSSTENVCISMKMGAVALAEDLINHLEDKNNPHGVTKEQMELENVNNTADMDKPVSTAQQAAIDAAYQQSTGYTDQKVAGLIDGAPETLDTLKEVADALAENEDVVSALNAAIGNKANQAELDTHVGNDTIHITATERGNWNLCGAKKSLSGVSNIEYSYPDLESKSITGVTGASSLTDALKDATGKLSESILGITPENIGAVTGVKGGAETAYRRGNVNITKTDIGLENVDNTADSAKSVKNAKYIEVTGGNEIRFSGNNGNVAGLWLNYSLPNGETAPTKLTQYIFGNGQRSTDGVSLKADLFTGKAATAGDADTVDGKHASDFQTTMGDTKDNSVTFTSADVADGNATSWTNVSKLSTGEKHSSIFNKISTMFKNVRYLYKMLGTTDISKIGNGTVTGSINALNSYLIDMQASRLDLSAQGQVMLDSSSWRNAVAIVVTCRSLFYAVRFSANTNFYPIVNNGDISFGNLDSDMHIFVINNLLNSVTYVSIFF